MFDRFGGFCEFTDFFQRAQGIYFVVCAKAKRFMQRIGHFVSGIGGDISLTWKVVQVHAAQGFSDVTRSKRFAQPAFKDAEQDKSEKSGDEVRQDTVIS